MTASAIEVASFDSTADETWSNAGISVGVVRSAEYLNWRYKRPGNVYRKFVLPGAGFLVLKFYNRGTQAVLHICDLVLHKHARGLCESILMFVQSLAARSRADLLTSWVPANHPYRPVFDDMGFMRDAGNDRFIFTTGPTELLPTLTNTASWHLSQGDSDVY